MIINPNKILKGSLPSLPFDTLKKLVVQTDEEIFLLRRELKDKRIHLGPQVITDFLRDALIINSDLLISSIQISHRYINSISIIYRSFLEIKVDYLWLYSHYLENEEIGVTLAKRYYQKGRDIFIELAPNFKRIEKNDPFLQSDTKLTDIETDITRAKSVYFIELVDQNEPNKKIKQLQAQDWHAVPGYYTKRNQLTFSNRAKVASELALRLFNLKAAPYKENWKLLNQFTHPSAMQYKIIDDNLAEKLHCRNVNIYLGFLHDMINVLCNYMKTKPNEKIRRIRMSFNYMST